MNSKKGKWKVKCEKWFFFPAIARYWTFKIEYFQLETFRAKFLHIFMTFVLKICWNQNTLVLNGSSHYCVQDVFVFVYDNICARIWWHLGLYLTTFVLLFDDMDLYLNLYLYDLDNQNLLKSRHVGIECN